MTKMPSDNGEHIVKCHQCKPKLVMYFDTEKEAKGFAETHTMIASTLNMKHAPVFGFINERHK